MRREGVRVGWRPNMVSQTEAVLRWKALWVTGLGPLLLEPQTAAAARCHGPARRRGAVGS